MAASCGIGQYGVQTVRDLKSEKSLVFVSKDIDKNYRQ